MMGIKKEIIDNPAPAVRMIVWDEDYQEYNLLRQDRNGFWHIEDHGTKKKIKEYLRIPFVTDRGAIRYKKRYDNVIERTKKTSFADSHKNIEALTNYHTDKLLNRLKKDKQTNKDIEYLKDFFHHLKYKRSSFYKYNELKDLAIKKEIIKDDKQTDPDDDKELKEPYNTTFGANIAKITRVHFNMNTKEFRRIKDVLQKKIKIGRLVQFDMKLWYDESDGTGEYKSSDGVDISWQSHKAEKNYWDDYHDFMKKVEGILKKTIPANVRILADYYEQQELTISIRGKK